MARLAQRVLALELAAQSAVTRGQVSAVRFVGNRALLQVATLAGERLEGVELLAPYGISAHPSAASEVLLLPVLGRRDLVVAIAGDALGAGVPGLAAGEVGFGDGVAWVSVQADGIHLHAGGRRVIVEDAADITISASGTIALQGAVAVTGSLTVNGQPVETGTD